MRHQVAMRKLGRTASHREALLKNLASALIMNGRITTTLHKAKELRRVAEQLITLGKKGSIEARRQVFAQIRNKDAVKKLFDTVAPAFSARNGGYTRIYQLGVRPGDSAKVAMIEYLREDMLAAKVEGKIADDTKASKKADKAKKAAKKAAAPKKEKAPKAVKAPKAKAAAADEAPKAAKKPRAKKAPAAE